MPSSRMRQLLHHAAAVVVARDDADLEAVQAQLLEREAQQHDDALGDVAVPGPRLVDPVADGADCIAPRTMLLRLTSPANAPSTNSPNA